MQKAQTRRRPRWRTGLALAVPAVALLAWWGITGFVRQRVDASIQQGVGRELPAFALTDRGGRQWRRDDLLGRRAVLHFFRSHCGSCDAEAEAWRQVERQLPADCQLLHVMTDAVLGFPAADTEATLLREAFRSPVVMADVAFVDAFHTATWSNVTPITYLVDATGVIRTGLRGGQTVETLRAAVAGRL